MLFNQKHQNLFQLREKKSPSKKKLAVEKLNKLKNCSHRFRSLNI